MIDLDIYSMFLLLPFSKSSLRLDTLDFDIEFFFRPSPSVLVVLCSFIYILIGDRSFFSTLLELSPGKGFEL